MKFPSTALSFVALLSTVNANMMECVTNVEDGKDYFPNKVEVEYSEHWSVEYKNTYKIVRNTDADTSYLLYQCGTTPPADEEGKHDATLSLPITNVGLHFTSYIPYMELLGLRGKIAVIEGQASWIYSPCLKKMIDVDEVTMVSDINNATLLGNVGVGQDLPYFVGVGSPNVFDQNFQVSEWKEGSSLSIFEWVKFFSVFFNAEDEANSIFEESKDTIDCARENANLLSADEEKPVVLWGAYSDYCGGWDVSQSCPNFYCELADTCSATLLTSAEGSIDSALCYRNYMTTEEFVAYGKDADIWIIPDYNSDFGATLAKFPELNDFESVKNDKVYDVSGQTLDAYFSQKNVEPHTLIEDFCSVVGRENPTTLVPYELTFLRHINDAIDSPPVCPEDQDAKDVPFVKLGSNRCVRITQPDAPKDTDAPKATEPPKDTSSASVAKILITSILSVGAALFF